MSTVRSDEDLSLLRAAFPEVLQVKTLDSHKKFRYRVRRLAIFGYKVSIIVMSVV